jgi:hypothetical protein
MALIWKHTAGDDTYAVLRKIYEINIWEIIGL